MGTGGGLCQVANLLYWLGLHAGLGVVERHRHDLDLFPDSNRDVPFGCGATVFYPHRDLKLTNPHSQPLLIEVDVRGGKLLGQVVLVEDPGFQIRVVETRHHFFRERGTVWRQNRIERWWYRGTDRVRREVLAENRAKVMYPVADDQLSAERAPCYPLPRLP
jgi:vancomycin resistance protein VanW